MAKVTKRRIEYPTGEIPNLITPDKYTDYRFTLGKDGDKPLVVIAMNPSRAAEDFSDRTVNKIIKASHDLGYEGWIVHNLYPERATDAKQMNQFSYGMNEQNLIEIMNTIKKFHTKDIWVAWGDPKHINLKRAKNRMLKMLYDNKIQCFTFADLTKAGNPRHPLYLPVCLDRKQFLSIKNRDGKYVLNEQKEGE